MRTFPKTFTEILTIPHLWPKKGDRLLRSSEDWDASATFSRHQLSRDAHIWDGYMTAGAALIDEAERRPIDRSVLVYPILFNYRHGLEAAMKWTIERYGGYFEIGLDEKDHNLWTLWVVCKKILIEADGDDDDILVVEQIVKDFHEVDKYAMAFRYSKNKNGATIPLPDKRVDLENIQRVMEAVDNFFTAADCVLGEHCANAPY
jgi:hypothetical protein